MMRTTSRTGMALMWTWTRLMKRAQGQMPMANQRLQTLKLVRHNASQKQKHKHKQKSTGCRHHSVHHGKHTQSITQRLSIITLDLQGPQQLDFL